MTTTTPVRFGVLGATSSIARRRVMPALESSPKTELVARASLSDPGLPGYDELLARDDVEAVYIPLPNELHAGWSVRAAEAGKHVLCEKPLARNAAEAADVVSACTNTGVVLMEAYMTPFHPRSAMADSIIRSGRLGELRDGRAVFTFPLDPGPNYRWSPDQGGGALLDLGIYCLSPLLAAGGGDPVSLAAAERRSDSGVDASFGGWLGFASGFTGSFLCSFDAPFRQRLEVTGSNGVLVVDRPFNPRPDDSSVRIEAGDEVVEVEAPAGDAYRGMVDHFATVVRGGAPLRHPPERSVRLLEVVDRLRDAAATVAQPSRG